MSAAPAVIRRAEVTDLAEVAAIFAHYVTDTVATFEEEPPPVGAWEQRLADLTVRGLPFLVAETGRTVSGYAYASPWRPKPAYRHTVEDSVYLAPGQTGRGIGSALLADLLTCCAEAGARQMIAVIADTGSGASAALHARYGFSPAGRLTGVGYKHGRWIDTLLMQRSLRGEVGPGA